MSGKGKRRSARLLKLEEQKNDGGSTAAVCFLDPWQIIRNSISGPSARGKRKRNEGIQVKKKGREREKKQSAAIAGCFQLSSNNRTCVASSSGSHLPARMILKQPQGEASCSRQEPLYAGNSSAETLLLCYLHRLLLHCLRRHASFTLFCFR